MEKKTKTSKMVTHKRSKVLFFPSEYGHKKLLKKLAVAKDYIYVAIYCLTNDKISAILWDLWQQGVDVRVITDDETCRNMGSDLKPLSQTGIPIRIDSNPEARMHNKFVVIDDRILINGSFNFTTSAYKKNNENLVVMYEKELIQAFKAEFLELWKQYEKGEYPRGEEDLPWRYKKHLQRN